MKRTRKRNGHPAHRISMVFLFLSAVAVLLYLTLSVWPRTAGREYERPEQPSMERPTAREATLPASPTPAPVIASESTGHSTATGSASILPRRGRIAVVIDDVGYDPAHLDRFLDFPGPLTIAVLPGLPDSTAAARRAHAAGKEVILHLPLEPLGNENPGPGAILVSFDRERIRETLDRDLESVPFADGVNNHMGSKGTQDPAVMDILFSYLKEKNLYFVDSRTTAATLGREYAGRYGVRMTERTFFLDNNPERADVQRVLNDSIVHARLKGAALLIGHAQHPVVVDVLEEVYGNLAASGVELVTVTDYLRFLEKSE